MTRFCANIAQTHTHTHADIRTIGASEHTQYISHAACCPCGGGRKLCRRLVSHSPPIRHSSRWPVSWGRTRIVSPTLYARQYITRQCRNNKQTHTHAHTKTPCRSLVMRTNNPFICARPHKHQQVNRTRNAKHVKTLLGCVRALGASCQRARAKFFRLFKTLFRDDDGRRRRRVGGIGVGWFTARTAR